MDVIYNSQDIKFKKPFGAVSCNAVVDFCVKSNDAERIFLHGFEKVYELSKTDELFATSITVPSNPCLVYYYFEVISNNEHFFIVPQDGMGGDCRIGSESDGRYQLTIYKNSPTPDWFKGAVMYQIYVDRFFRPKNNPPLKKNILFHSSWDDMPMYIFDSDNRIVQWDFFGGNLQGIIEKLDYIKGLGVDVIYFNPIFDAYSNHKYDTADYSKIDSMYGNDKILEELIKKAKKKNIHIILDGVFSHTGDDSVYFNKYGNYDNFGAYQSEKSPYYDWFQFYHFPNDYKSWWGFDALPEVDKNCQSYREFLFNSKNGIIKKWMELGIMGWRLDVADELPDDFIKQLKQTAKSFCNASIVLGEVWEDASNKVSYGEQRKYIIDDSLDSVSNYPLRDSIINYLLGKNSSYDLCRLIMRLQENYPSQVFNSLMNLTGTHDSVRLATLLGNAPDNDNLGLWEKRKFKLGENNYQVSISRIKLFFLVLFTLPGNPCIYYGDETAMQGHKDPYNRATFPWEHTRDDLHNLIVELAGIRRENTAFKVGFFDYDFKTADVLCYNLRDDENQFKIIINRSDSVNHNIQLSYAQVLLTLNAQIHESEIRLLPFGGVILKIN